MGSYGAKNLYDNFSTLSMLEKYTVSAPTMEGRRNRNVLDIMLKTPLQVDSPNTVLNNNAYTVGMATILSRVMIFCLDIVG